MKKNLLFVFADQWRRSALGFEGTEDVLTPRMDEFAMNSVYCTNGISSSPLCSPARAAILTGKHPLATGVFTNCKNGSEHRLREEEVTLSATLAEAGYRTGYIGKWHLDEPESNYDPEPESGARHWDAYTPPGPRRFGFEYWHSYGADDQHLSPHYWEDSPEQILVSEWSPRHETDKAIEFLNQKDSRPFCLFLSWNPPHNPYDEVPEEYLSLYRDHKLRLRTNISVHDIQHHTYEPAPMNQDKLERTTKQYYAAISGLDEQFARLIQELKDNQIYENTLIVLTSDHGDMLGSHGLIGKHVWYEESIGVPLMFGGAGLKPGTCSTVISSQDLAPTILSLLDMDIPEAMTGVDCSIDIRTHDSNANKVALIAACPGRDIFLEDFARAFKDPKSYGWRGVRTQDYTYVIEAGYRPVSPDLKYYLYDLVNDPYQLSPLCLEDNYKIATELQDKLLYLMKKESDPFLVHDIRETNHAEG